MDSSRPHPGVAAHTALVNQQFTVRTPVVHIFKWTRQRDSNMRSIGRGVLPTRPDRSIKRPHSGPLGLGGPLTADRYAEGRQHSTTTRTQPPDTHTHRPQDRFPAAHTSPLCTGRDERADRKESHHVARTPPAGDPHMHAAAAGPRHRVRERDVRLGRRHLARRHPLRLIWRLLVQAPPLPVLPAHSPPLHHVQVGVEDGRHALGCGRRLEVGVEVRRALLTRRRLSGRLAQGRRRRRSRSGSRRRSRRSGRTHRRKLGIAASPAPRHLAGSTPARRLYNATPAP